jgi:hypothetical protein
MVHLIFEIVMGFLAFGSVLVGFASVIGIAVWILMKLGGWSD